MFTRHFPKIWLVVATFSIAFIAFTQSAGTTFPSKTITLIVPYAAGGSSDTRARQIAAKMAAALPYLKPTPPKARALAVASAQRLPQLPDVPTFAELGYKNFEVSNWFGIIAPKGTPAPVVAKLNEAVNRALKEPEIAERITGQGNVIGGGSAAEFAGFIAAESARWAKIIKDKNIQPN